MRIVCDVFIKINAIMEIIGHQIKQLNICIQTTKNIKNDELYQLAWKAKKEI